MKNKRKKTEVVICVGAGGVGKTTVASVLAIYYALLGEKTLVITVDPARRLLDAMGLIENESVPKEVDLNFLVKKPSKKGGLFAFMPDLKKEWMDFIHSAIESPKARNAITSNPFYQYAIDGLPGVFEIICSHVLFRLMNEGEYDRIILDTPPSSHSLSFFDVPSKVSLVLEQGLFQSILRSRNSLLFKFTKKLAFFSGGLLENTLEKLIGSHFLSELIDFALILDGLYDPLLTRVKAMENLLKDKETKYVLVLRPNIASINDCLLLKKALNGRSIAINQIIINQVMPIIDSKIIKQELEALKERISIEEQAKVSHIFSLYDKEVLYEKKLLAKIFEEFNGIDAHMLYLCNTLKNRKDLMVELLRHYQETGQ